METCGTEEPYEGKPHVRICGGAGWVTTGSTRTADACQPSLVPRCGCQARLRPSVRLRAAEVGGRQVLRERRGVLVSGVWRVTRGRRGVGTPVGPERVAVLAASPGVCAGCRVRSGVPVGLGYVLHQGYAGRLARVACLVAGWQATPSVSWLWTVPVGGARTRWRLGMSARGLRRSAVPGGRGPASAWRPRLRHPCGPADGGPVP